MPDKTIEQNLTLAAHFLSIGRPARVLEHLQKATIAERETVRYWRLLASAYDRLDKLDKAERAARAGLAAFPEDIGLLRLLAGAQRQLGNTADAEQTLRLALDRQPDDATLHFDLAYTAHKAAAFADAAQWLASGVQLAPESQHALRLPALIAYGRKDWISAETHTKTWIRAYPNNSSARYLLADILAQQGRRSLEAEEQLAKAAQLDASSGAALTLRKIERRKTGFIEGILLFCVVSAAGIALLGLYIAIMEGDLIYLWMTLLAGLAAAYLLWMVWHNRRSVTFGSGELRIGSGRREQVIPYSSISAVRHTLAGVVLHTTAGRQRLARINQHEQNDLRIRLSNIVTDAAEASATRQKMRPFTVFGNWWYRLLQLILLACGGLGTYAFIVSWPPDGSVGNWLNIGVGLLMLPLFDLLILWWIFASPLYVRFSAETITIRYPLKAYRYPASRLRYAGLRRGYRVYTGQQLPNHTIDLHFADDETVKLDQNEIHHPPGDLLPLHELAKRLQAYYDVPAPSASETEIGRYVV